VEQFASRLEIRRRILARMGKTTNGSQAAQTTEQYNEVIRAAAEAVYMRCPWAQSQREATESVGIDQRFVNYPENSGPGNIIAIGVWMADEQRYRPLRRGRIPVELDDEPLVEEGGDVAAEHRATPSLYEVKAQIEVWPRPDQEYRLKIDYTVHPDLDADADVSVVDAECIVLWAMADLFEFEGDQGLATIQRNKFQDRINLLIANQHPLQTIRRGRHSLTVRSDEYVPTSGTWPSVMVP
jgi:hypothetical protein